MDTQMGSKFAASPTVHVEAGSSGKRTHGRARGGKGQAMLEFAIVAPVLLTVLLAISVLGIAFNNYLTLTHATSTAAQLLSISRGQTSDPCATTSAAVEQAAPYLKTSNLTFSIALGSGSPITYGTPYTGTSCTSASLVEGQTAKVTTTYPCSLLIYGHNYAPGCTLAAQTAVFIQ